MQELFIGCSDGCGAQITATNQKDLETAIQGSSWQRFDSGAAGGALNAGEL